MSRTHEIDFDNELHNGKKTYTGKVGKWWADRCSDRVHQTAYKNIACRLAAALGRRKPRLIVEYACGAGHLLSQIARQFPTADLIGIDGSHEMLALTRLNLERAGALDRTSLWEGHLPDFELPAWDADAVIFAFPNICPGPDDQAYYDRYGSKHPLDRPMGRALAYAREEDPEMETYFGDSKELMIAMLDCKVISRNLRALVRKGGLCVRADYANAPREDLSDLVQMRMDFEAGALARPFKGKHAEQIFKLIDSTYHRSKVILDVYDQTGDELDKTGGYQVNILRAL